MDESTGCDYEIATVCAFNQSASAATQVGFLECMDETSISNNALNAAKPCAESSKLDYSKLTDCFKNGQGAALAKEASKEFNAKLPGRTTIPHTFVNSDDVEPQYAKLKDALCSAGSTASACSKTMACEV